MATSLSRKLATLIVKNNISVSDVSESLAKYKLLSLLPSIGKEVKQMNENNSLLDTISIESPFEINETAIDRIKKIVGNDLAPYQVTINKNILAGFKARYKGKLYDGSAERIIRQLIK